VPPDDPPMRVVLVAAVAANGVIGADGETPWHLPADLEQFRELTVGHPVVVGRRTHEAIRARLGGPLPDRTNVVLTNSPGTLPDDVVAADSVAAAVDAAAATGAETAYVAGGGSVYEQFLPRADALVLSELDEAFDGDTYFPAFDPARWREAGRERYDRFDVVTYVRDGEAG